MKEKEQERVKVTCQMCGKHYTISAEYASELWPDGFEDRHQGYVCQKCEAEAPWNQE